MEIGIICPTKFLNEFAGKSNYHLVLAHMIRDNPDYLEFYRDRYVRGSYLTLDNSSYEIGDGVFTPEDLIDFAVEVGAKEVMAPEMYLNAEKTVELAKEFYEYFQSSEKAQRANLKIFAVVHGESAPMMKWCHNELLKYADTIGFSCRIQYKGRQNEFYIATNYITTTFNISWGSALMRANFIHSILPNMKPEKRYHLLGLNHPAELLFYKDKAHEFIKSNDSSAAYLSGTIGQSFDTVSYKKPEIKLDFEDVQILTHIQRAAIEKNIGIWKAFAE